MLFPHNLILDIDILSDLHLHDLEQGFCVDGVESAAGDADGLSFGDGEFVAVEFDVAAAFDDGPCFVTAFVHVVGESMSGAEGDLDGEAVRVGVEDVELAP